VTAQQYQAWRSSKTVTFSTFPLEWSVPEGFAIGYRILAIGYWRLAIGYRRLVIGITEAFATAEGSGVLHILEREELFRFVLVVAVVE
jgi:hypothetical protein